MDLVTLVTACALAVEPKLMHALIWHQSGGEPWAISVQSEPNPRVYSSMRDAIRETRAGSARNDTVRVGLAGLSIAPSKVAAAVLLPCRNVAIAAAQIAKLADRCKSHPRLKADTTFCAVAVYRGSWEQPDVKFAEAVATSVAKGDPTSTCRKTPGSSFSTWHPRRRRAWTIHYLRAVSASDERERGWSSALFPIRPQQPASQLKDNSNGVASAEKAPPSRVSNEHSSTAKSPVESLFVPRSSDRKRE